MKIRIDKEAWSDESKRSYSYDSHIEFYEDERYQCVKCGCSAVFSAQEQKEAFEVKKRYIWQRRTLCKSCYGELLELKKELSMYEEMWSQESAVTKKSAPYLQSWLTAINAMPSYGKPKNHAKAQKLFNLINNGA